MLFIGKHQKKTQSRSSRENWRDQSEHVSWRKPSKIEVDDENTQRLLVYFDTRMKMYQLMKEKFLMENSDNECFMHDLCIMEHFTLSPPSSRLAQRRHERGGNKCPYQQTHLITAF